MSDAALSPDMTANLSRPAAARPAVSAFLAAMLLSGAAATVAFDLFGQALSPLFGFARLAPVPLASQTWATLTGVNSGAMGHLLHYVAGLIAYPLGWLMVREGLARSGTLSALPRGLALTGAVVAYGVALWVFALWFMASVVNGNPPFLNFTGITWVALVGHVLFAAVTAAVAEPRLRR